MDIGLMLAAFDSLLQGLIQQWGLFGIFVAAIIANATIFLPMPLDIMVFSLGALSKDIGFVFAAGIFAGAGAAIGEMTAYIVGLLGISAVEKAKHKEYEQLEGITKKLNNKGFVFIAIAALTPFPFDLVGIAAGIIKYDPKKFFVACLAGKLARYILIVLGGFLSLGIVKTVFMLG